MATTRNQTEAVLASARRELEAQLAVVRKEMTRLAGEEQALTDALSHLKAGNGARSAAGAPAGDRTRQKRASRPRANGRRRATSRSAAANKSTADRVKELQTALAEGERSRGDLATALGVSPARVQQLLAELGGSVKSRKNPDNARMTLWSLKGTANGNGAAKPTAARRGSTRTRPSKARSSKKAAAKK